MKDLVGVDLFIHWSKGSPDELANELNAIEMGNVSLSMITNRGIKVWPNGFEETFCTDHWRCRFLPINQKGILKTDIIKLLTNYLNADIDVVKTENLYEFDGKPAFSLGQGQ